MRYIHNLNELNELERDLIYKDRLHFITKHRVLEYEVASNHLHISGGDFFNNHIFKYLRLNKEEKYNLADKCYGYINYGGEWPESKNSDYKALTKLVREIYKMLDRMGMSNKIEEKFEPILSRFEILDL